MEEQLTKSAHVDIEIPLSSGELVKVGGSVIYVKEPNGDGSDRLPGMAIKFDRLTYESITLLSGLVEELLIGDIIAEQTEPVVKPS